MAKLSDEIQILRKEKTQSQYLKLTRHPYVTYLMFNSKHTQTQFHSKSCFYYVRINA